MNRTHDPALLAAVGDAVRERVRMKFPGKK